jgi:hypothetical protein
MKWKTKTKQNKTKQNKKQSLEPSRRTRGACLRRRGIGSNERGVAAGSAAVPHDYLRVCGH